LATRRRPRLWSRSVLALAFASLAAVPRAGAAAVDRWALDPARTHISFSVDAIGYARAAGEFRSFDGRVAVDFEHPALSRVDFRVQAMSIDAGSQMLSAYLRSDAFFDAARFGEIAFASTRVEKIGEEKARVIGDLTMLGVTRPLTVDVEVRRLTAGPHARFEIIAHATINRLEYGMTAGYPLISRDVELVVVSAVAE
jgi:polyisoprenoid-binding protein YceI